MEIGLKMDGLSGNKILLMFWPGNGNGYQTDFISPKIASPHKHKAPRPPKPLHIQKVSVLIPLGSPLMLLCLLVVGCWLLPCCCCFWWCFWPCCWQWSCCISGPGKAGDSRRLLNKSNVDFQTAFFSSNFFQPGQFVWIALSDNIYCPAKLFRPWNVPVSKVASHAKNYVWALAIEKNKHVVLGNMLGDRLPMVWLYPLEMPCFWIKAQSIQFRMKEGLHPQSAGMKCHYGSSFHQLFFIHDLSIVCYSHFTCSHFQPCCPSSGPQSESLQGEVS